MNSLPKSALFIFSVATLCLFTLAACSENNSLALPHVFGGNEVPDNIINEPRLVTTALPNASADAAWPRLGDVPPKPRNFTTTPLIDQTKLEMKNDRANAEQKRDEIENPPFFVPPTLAN